jgi:hypothetical protein
MLRLIDRRTFVPHSSSCYNATAEQIIKKVSEFCSNISTQLYQTRTAQITPENGTKFSDLELDALANIITYELIYYHQLGEIGRFCASENPLSSSMLAASENIHKKIGDVCMKMGVASEQYLLGPAGHITVQQRHYIGLLTHSILVCLGGCSFKGGQMTSSISINEILAELAEIAKTAWSMINTYRSAAEGTNNIMVCPNESVFGNYSWAPREEVHPLFLMPIHKLPFQIPV